MNLKIFSDGGSRGNPGNSGIGMLIIGEDGKVLEKRYKNIGLKTNNQAEYLGAYFAIKRAISIGAKNVELNLDSKLVVKQLSGERKIKEIKLKKIFLQIKESLIKSKINIKYNWIPRELNKEADRLSNIAMNNF